jgi:hypothetical protein
VGLPYIDPAARSRLADCRERLAELRKQRTRIQDHLASAKQALNSVSGSMDATALGQSEEFRRVERAMRDRDDIATKIASVEEEERYLLGRLSGTEGIGHRENFLQDPNTLEELRLMANSTEPIGRRILGEAVSRDELLAHFEQRRRAAGVMGDSFGAEMLAAAGDVTLPSDTSRTAFWGVVRQPRRRLSILDLINTAPMDVGSFDYLLETGSMDTGPAETAELAQKPSDNLVLTEATAKAQTIADWARMSKPQLADVPALQTTVQTRVMYRVLAGSRIRSSPAMGRVRTSKESSTRRASEPRRRCPATPTTSSWC